MADFLEEQLALSVRYGARYGDDYNVEITQVNSGAEYRRLVHGFPIRRFRVDFRLATPALYSSLVNLWHRAYGRYAGFRVKCLDDYTTNGQTLAPTAFDDAMALVSTGLYQLQNFYGTGGTPLAIGLPARTLFKPVAGTVRVGIGAVEILNSPVVNWTVVTSTGRVTFSANKTAAITGISKAAAAVISCAGHTLLVGEYVYISGNSGMTQINGQRAVITAISAGVSVTVAINSSAYSTWASGGSPAVNTRPQVGESVTAGCEFDIPVRFDSALDIVQGSPVVRDVESVELIELLAP